MTLSEHFFFSKACALNSHVDLVFSPFSGVLMMKGTITTVMYLPHDSNSNVSEYVNVLSVLKLYQRDFTEEVF